MSNTLIRIIVSFLAIPAIVIITYLGKFPFLLFVLAIGLIAYYEFSRMVTKKEVYTNLYIGSLSVLLIIINNYLSFIEFNTLFLLIIMFILITELFRNKKSAIFNTGATLVGVFYIGLFSSMLINIRELYKASEMMYSQGGLIIISLLASIWICDSAAFFLGSAFGKHKLFPRISPNKTWEGAAAGFVFAILTMIAARIIILDFLSWQDVIVMGIIVGSIGQAGDLVESLFKRDAGVKDSSAFIPGHGGVFDRFDSLLLSSPIIYLYLYYFVI